MAAILIFRPQGSGVVLTPSLAIWHRTFSVGLISGHQRERSAIGGSSSSIREDPSKIRSTRNFLSSPPGIAGPSRTLSKVNVHFKNMLITIKEILRISQHFILRNQLSTTFSKFSYIIQCLVVS